MRQGLRLALVLGALFVVRTLVHPYGIFHADFLSWVAWGHQLWEGDWANFYDRAWNDRLPAVFYLLSVLAGLHALFPALPATLLYKLPANIADLAIAWLLFRALAPALGARGATLASLAYALNPFSWHVSAFWGQLDAVQALLLVAVVLLLHRKRPLAATVFLMLAALIKPHSLALVPLLAASMWKQRTSARHALGTGVRALALAAATAWVVTAPFAPRARWWSLPAAPFAFLAERVRIASDQYQYASVNAFNFWSALGGNWQPDTAHFAGVTLQQWGVLLFAGGMLAVLWRIIRRRASLDLPVLAESAALLSLLAFTVLTRAHERHLYPFFALFALAGLPRARDRALYAILTASALANTLYAYVTLERKQPDPFGQPLIALLSLLPVAACLLLLFFPRRAPLPSIASQN